MTRQWNRAAVLSATMALTASVASGQVVWDVFEDLESNARCGVINTANNELVLLSDTAQLMIVSRTDTILVDTFVDDLNLVTFEGFPAGSIEFAEDADGLRSLWWLTLDGFVVELDSFTAEPLVTDTIPLDYRDIPCDACNFVDSPAAEACDDGGVIVPPVVIPPVNVRICGNGVGIVPLLTMMFGGLLLCRLTKSR